MLTTAIDDAAFFAANSAAEGEFLATTRAGTRQGSDPFAKSGVELTHDLGYE